MKYWFAFNEPIVVQTCVYLDALRWPFERDTDLDLSLCHGLHLLLLNNTTPTTESLSRN